VTGTDATGTSPLPPDVQRFLTEVAPAYPFPVWAELDETSGARYLAAARVPVVVPPGPDVADVDSEDRLLRPGLGVRIYRRRDEAQGGPVVVYLHGGGWVMGDLELNDGWCRWLVQQSGIAVVSVDYRLAPEHRFPAAVEDAYAALTDVAAHIDDYGGDRDRLVVGGDSAGGNLAAVCTQLARADGVRLAAQLLVYPAVDMLEDDYPSRTENAEGYFLTLDDMHWFAEQYTGLTQTDPRVRAVIADPRLSPLHAASLEGLPPAVVVTAEFDPLRDEGDAYAAALEKAGVRVEHKQLPGLIHGFYGLELLSPAVAEATRWVNGRLKDLLG
jgi:acetyl esterase